MKAASFLIVACGFIATSVLAQGQGLPPQAPPGQGGWTTEDARRMPNRPFENSFIVATVVKLSVRQKSGRFIVTLDNGQRWSQIQNKPDVSVSIGDEIKIQKSTLGSFMLTTANGTETRVKRDR
jgi:endoglucanase Acf2